MDEGRTVIEKEEAGVGQETLNEAVPTFCESVILRVGV